MPKKSRDETTNDNTSEAAAVVTKEDDDSMPPESVNEGNDEGNQEENDHEEEEEEEQPRPRLYKSTRLNGYITLASAAAINYNEARHSLDVISDFAVKATTNQKQYALAVSSVTGILCAIAILAHIDRFTPLRKFWEMAFEPKSRIELCLLSFLVLWWAVAAFVETTVRGIAGDGKGQYNLYFTTWACLLTSVWTLEKWMVACGHASLKEFLASWPNRAPGWIVICVLSFVDMFCILDLFLFYEDAGTGSLEQFKGTANQQWEWLLFVTAVSVPSSLGFVLVEIFREDKPNEEDKHTKSEWETVLEGFVLFLLVVMWIPTVIVATTPGGVASLVGNSYFFTWATAVFVMETGIWWIHDWRKRIHVLLQQQEKEYSNIQEEVLQRTRQQVQMMMQVSPPGSPVKRKDSKDGEEEEDESEDSDYDAPNPMPDALGT